MRLIVQALRRIQNFKPQELTNMACSIAKCALVDTRGSDSAPLVGAVAEEALHKLDKFEAQHLPYMSWAFAKLQYWDPALLEALSKKAMEKAVEMKPEELSAMLWAIAALRMWNIPLFQALRDHARNLPDGIIQFRTIATLARS